MEKREEELRWKVKENIVNTIIGFIWFVLLPWSYFVSHIR
jgi:hypothetical protein